MRYVASCAQLKTLLIGFYHILYKRKKVTYMIRKGEKKSKSTDAQFDGYQLLHSTTNFYSFASFWLSEYGKVGKSHCMFVRTNAIILDPAAVNSYCYAFIRVERRCRNRKEKARWLRVGVCRGTARSDKKWRPSQNLKPSLGILVV